VFRMLVFCGIGFVTPVFVVALNLAGIVHGKTILKAWRWVLIFCLVFGMMVSSPADIITMVVMASILFVLYMAATVFALIVDARRKKTNPDLFVDVE
jgi:sec-independent protein translocase protein TatC